MKQPTSILEIYYYEPCMMYTATVIISYQRIAGWSPFFNNFICKVEAQVKFFHARISDLFNSKLIHFWIISFKVLIKKEAQFKTKYKYQYTKMLHGYQLLWNLKYFHSIYLPRNSQSDQLGKKRSCEVCLDEQWVTKGCLKQTFPCYTTAKLKVFQTERRVPFSFTSWMNLKL